MKPPNLGTSIQHYHLNCVFLAASDPHVPRFGPGHREAHRKAEVCPVLHLRSTYREWTDWIILFGT
jgi:hypothetical protein